MLVLALVPVQGPSLCTLTARAAAGHVPCPAHRRRHHALEREGSACVCHGREEPALVPEGAGLQRSAPATRRVWSLGPEVAPSWAEERGQPPNPCGSRRLRC